MSKEAKTSLMPVAALLIGLNDKCSWAETWVALLNEFQVIVEGKVVAAAVICQPNRAGEFILSKPVSSGSATTWLHELLISNGIPHASTSEIATHSLKCTALSWLAKFGAPAEHRRVLGYHVGVDDGSMAIYSRDLIATPLRTLDMVMTRIRQKTFMPDSSRSGYMKSGSMSIVSKAAPPSKPHPKPEGMSAPSAEPNPLHKPDVDVKPNVIDTDSDSSGDSTTSDEEVDCEEEEQFCESLAEPSTDVFDGGTDLFQNKHSGMLHKRGSVTRLTCNRVITANFSLIKKALRFEWPKCSKCFPVTS